MGARQWRVEAFKLKVRPGCDLCSKHHTFMLNRLGTWMCVACAGPAASDIAEDGLYGPQLHPANKLSGDGVATARKAGA